MDAAVFALAARLPNPLAFAAVALITGFLLNRLVLRGRPIGQFLCQLISITGFTILLAIAGVVPFKPTPVMQLGLAYVIISFFKLLWWLAAAWLAAGFVRAALVFKRKPLETRFLQDLCAGAIYISASLGVVSDVFDVPISGLLAASGVIAIVLGLALQSTLGDVFSGVVLNLARPYHPGDWVILDGGLEGRVTETNWRATYLLTEGEDIAIVPNSLIAKSRFINASKPAGAHGVKLSVGLDPSVSPLGAVAVLETALLSCTLIMRFPTAWVTVRSLDALALQCDLTFFVPRIEDAAAARNEVFDRIFRHCASAGIRIAPPPGSPCSVEPRETPHGSDDVPRRLLERLAVFATLSDVERAALAPKITSRIYDVGQVVVDEGTVGPALFILTSGVLAAFQRYPGGENEILRFAPGDCFGQGSVLTGAAAIFKVTALTRAVVYEIAKEDMAPILLKRPAVAAELDRILARREAAGRQQLSERQRTAERSERNSGGFTDFIKRAFGIR